MSELITAPSAPPPHKLAEPVSGRGRKRRLQVLWILLVLLVVTGAIYGGWRGYRRLTKSAAVDIPVVRVERGDIQFTITAKGELQGGNPEILAAPMTSGGTLHITFLRKPGEQVKTGDVVVQFDTTEQKYKLKEAQFDLLEASQKIIQAKAKHAAEVEEDQYSLVKARNDLTLAELEARKNRLLPAITAKQNDLAVQNAGDHLAQVEKNVANRQATGGAGIEIERAGQAKAESQATTARQNIEAMTLRAHHAGYVAVKQNMPTDGFFFDGMVMPLFQIGDSANPGMAIAEIPDLGNWQVTANINELDRGHIGVGNPVQITVIAIPQRRFEGTIKDMGGTTGPFWDRHFESKIALKNPIAELRPGMTATLVITTQTLRNVLSVPAQSLFDSGGKSSVFVRSGKAFTPRPVQLVQKNETRAVITGLHEGDFVALSNPTEASNNKAGKSGPLGAVGK